jgi:lactate dehydrogenase-like 2-hydroxyacid dehydrogenase
MAEIVVSTPLQLAKGGAVFRAAFDVREAPPEESALAAAILRHNARAAIVGSDPYVGPLYEALGQTGGSRGALIARFGVGHDNVDKRLARRHHIVVTNTPGVLHVSVAEHTMWLLGSLARHVASMSLAFKVGQFAPQTGIEIRGKTLGLVGFGAIGREVARIAHQGFGMRILAVDPRPAEQLENELGKRFAEIRSEFGLHAYVAEPEAILPECDFVSLHLPALPETLRFFDARRLARMKPGAMLINTARGWVVDESALYDALAGGRIAAAALDVFHAEPYEPVSPDKDLRKLSNVLLTPHAASNTFEANRRIAECVAANVARFFAGRIDEMTRVG